MSDATNKERLTKAGVIPADYKGLTDAEEAAINSLSSEEIDAIISASSKVSGDFFKKHAPHGMAY